jgi:hypothetical protein
MTLNCVSKTPMAIPVSTGKCSAAPADARSAFGANGLAVPLCPVAAVTTPVAPNAAAVRTIVPTFPGSCTPANTTISAARPLFLAPAASRPSFPPGAPRASFESGSWVFVSESCVSLLCASAALSASLRGLLPSLLCALWVPISVASVLPPFFSETASFSRPTNSSNVTTRGTTNAATPCGCSVSAIPANNRSVVRSTGNPISAFPTNGANLSLQRSPLSLNNTASTRHPELSASSTIRKPSTPTAPVAVATPPRSATRNSFNQRFSRLIKISAPLASRDPPLPIRPLLIASPRREPTKFPLVRANSAASLRPTQRGTLALRCKPASTRWIRHKVPLALFYSETLALLSPTTIANIVLSLLLLHCTPPPPMLLSTHSGEFSSRRRSRTRWVPSIVC